MPPYPYFRALYAVPVRQVRGLLTASFRFRLTADTLAVRLCASLLPTRTWDFHPLENAHAGQTKSARTKKCSCALSLYLKDLASSVLSLSRVSSSIRFFCLRVLRFPFGAACAVSPESIIRLYKFINKSIYISSALCYFHSITLNIFSRQVKCV